MSIVAEPTGSSGLDRLPRLSARRLAVWVSLALVCLAALAALLLMQGIDRQIRDVTKTYSVRSAAQELSQALSQAEASQRGYLLTADPQFLAPYERAASSIDARIEALLAMTSDDSYQSQRVGSITGDIAARMAEMARAVELVSAQRQYEARSLTETGMGARLMEEVGRTLGDFIAEEDLKLSERNLAIDRTRVGLVGALIAALIGAAILAYALLARSQKRVSDLAMRQRGLENENDALEAQVAARTRDIEDARLHAEHERQRVEALLQDTNHRVGNSLATVSSLLALQMMRSPSKDVQDALEAARLRVHAIASAHRRLRLGDDLETSSADEFLAAVIEDIAATQTDGGRIALSGEIEAIQVSARDATTLGILVGELVTNALKHAFPDGRSGAIKVRLFSGTSNVPMLQVIDDGVGMDLGEHQGETGLGSVIVRQLASQFGGKPAYSHAADGGLEINVDLPGLVRPPVSPEEK